MGAEFVAKEFIHGHDFDVAGVMFPEPHKVFGAATAIAKAAVPDGERNDFDAEEATLEESQADQCLVQVPVNGGVFVGAASSRTVTLAALSRMRSIGN